MNNETIKIRDNSVLIQYEDIQETKGIKEIPITYNIKGGNIVELVPVSWSEKTQEEKIKHITNRVEQRLEQIYRLKFKNND